jgi:1-phosphatidylinositol-3-phosphate 5-kinase
MLDGNFLVHTSGLACALYPRSYTKLMEAVQNDTTFLGDNNIMDYSLIIGYAAAAGDDDAIREGDDDDATDDHVHPSHRLLFVGIIDYLRHFDFIKRMENVGKSSVAMIAGQAAPTIVQPKHYAKRFLEAMQYQYFMPVHGTSDTVFPSLKSTK